MIIPQKISTPFFIPTGYHARAAVQKPLTDRHFLTIQHGGAFNAATSGLLKKLIEIFLSVVKSKLISGLDSANAVDPDMSVANVGLAIGFA